MSDNRFVAWLLNRESRTAWIALELLRPLPPRLRFSNAWWQLRHFGDCDAFHALWLTHDRSRGRYKA